MFNASAVGKLRELVLQRAGTACDAAVDQLAHSQSAEIETTSLIPLLACRGHRRNHEQLAWRRNRQLARGKGAQARTGHRSLLPGTYRGQLEEARRCIPSDSGRFPRKFVSGSAV
jgi:hypothetical protein